MTRKRCLGIVVVLVCFAFVSGCSEQSSVSKSVSKSKSSLNMEPGEWSITSKMESPNMPISMPATTHSQCLTEEDMAPKTGSAESGDCSVSGLKVSGDTVSYTIKCSSGGSMTSSNAVLTYRGTTMEGTITSEVSGPAAMKMTTRMSGKRIGPCK